MTKQDAPDLTLASAPPPALTAVGGFPEGATRPLREETVAQVAGAMGEQGSPSGRVRVPHGAAAKERFIDLEPIGQGGMGEVFRVTDSVLRRDLAMKIIRPHVEQQPDLVAAFLTEAQVTAQLDHPGIVPVHDLGASADGSGVFFTMKRVIGVNLSEQLLGLRGTRPQYQVLKRLIGYLIKVCHALEFAHARGVLHCDIKPANIMIGDYDQVYLMDWGVAVIKQDVGHKPTAPGAHLVPFGADAIGSTSGPLSGVVSGPVSSYPTTNRGVVGTPAYMAPEQASGSVAVLDERTDVYGLGGVLYEILGGKAPNHRRPSVLPGLVAEEVRPPEEGEIWDDLPPGLVDAALTALRKAKEARQSSVAVFRQQLETFLDGGGWFEAQRFSAGRVIVTQGERADTAYIIEAGQCEVFVEQMGQRTSVGVLNAGDVFGETATLSTGVRTATVVALDEVVLRVVTRESLDNELSRNPWVGAFVRALGARYRALERRLAERES